MIMNEYISKESVNRIILEAIRYCDNQSDQTDDLTLKFSWDKCSGMLESVKESVDNIPNADVRPVVHGKWVKIYEDGEPAIEQHQIGVFCSKCMKIPKDRFTESEFCPNCGCYMGGETNG